MFKNYFSFSIAFSYCLLMYSQVSVSALYSYNSDFKQTQEFLIANEEKSVYKMVDNNNSNPQLAQFKQEGNKFYVKKRNSAVISNFIFNNINNYECKIYLETKNKKFIVSDVVPKLEWELNSGYKVIGKYKCSQATLSFRGRNYVAWYAADIAIPFGPFKFKGLPGLIIEIYSNDDFPKVSWTLKSISFDAESEIQDESDYDGIAITLKKILEIDQAERDSRFNRVTSRLNRSVVQTSSKTKRVGPERIYEWELKESEKQ